MIRNISERKIPFIFITLIADPFVYNVTYPNIVK